jgi:two-component system chemotaxis sensor kinase CheA
MTQTETIAGNDLFASLQDDWEAASRYLSMFIDEVEHTVDELVEALLALEAGGGPENIKQLFIAAHRIKGSAASIGLNRVAKLAHFMEDLLQALVDSGQMITPAIADAMLAGTDGLRHYVDSLKAGRPEESQFDALAKQLKAARTAFDQTTAPAGADAGQPTTEPLSEPDRRQSSATGLDLHQLVAALVRESEHETVLVGHVIFQPALPQVGLKAQLIYEKLSNLGEVRYFDPPAADIEMREQLDSVRFGVATEKSADAVQRLLRIGGIESLLVEPLAAAIIPPADAPASPRGKTLEPGLKPAETVRVDIGRLDQLMDLAGQLVIGKARVTQIAERLKKVVANGASARTLSAVTTELEKMAEGAAAAAGGAALRAEMEDLRNTARQLHRDLVGVHQDIESLAQARACVNDLFETVHLLDRVSDGIHQSVMDTRMLPVGPLFARFHRVIRDITHANGKDIRLVISGEKTELDKRMIDELADPMIHMIRNAADHGIESPEVRIAAGKPRQGTIRLDACHRGSNIVIRVSDDGQGLSHERIRAKAVDKGLISAADAERMTPQQLYQLIWLPGLSTAEKVTEVSGRGVGMDIVRSTIDELNGTTDIDSAPGRGTTLTIKLPLTLAILPSLMVDIGGDVFALPLESVVEIVDVRRRDVTTVCGLPTVSVRDRVVCILTLGTIFKWRQGNAKTENAEAETITLVIVNEGKRQLGLAVDRVLGEEDVVIKSIADNYRNVVGIAGASILGDGRISLILDPPALIEMSSHSTAAGADS